MGSRRAIALWLIACAQLAAGDGAGWPLYQGNERRTGLSKGTGPASWKKSWVVQRNFGNYEPAPAVVGPDGTVYAVMEGDFPRTYFLSAFKPGGKARWTCALTDDAHAAPAVAPDGGIVIGLLDGTVQKVTARGKKAWALKTQGAVTSSAAFAPDGTAYIGSEDDSLYAIAPDGTLRWTFATGGWVCAPPAIGPDGTVYAASWDACVYAVSPEGKEKWRFRTGRPITACPVVADDGTVYVASEDGCLYALTKDGEKAWKFETGGWIYFTPCLDPSGNIAFGSNDGSVYSLSPKGEQRWKIETGPAGSNPACDARGTVYIVCNGTLRAIAADGKEAWSRTDCQADSLALAEDGTLFLLGTQFLYAVHD